mmetsp:Transcript_96566/g.273465  ORF Transcript_96566/g.273465 Transcript_96566/m.273465 type:complete len:213 (-) Transcript_96566:651-1289(-)
MTPREVDHEMGTPGRVGTVALALRYGVGHLRGADLPDAAGQRGRVGAGDLYAPEHVRQDCVLDPVVVRLVPEVFPAPEGAGHEAQAACLPEGQNVLEVALLARLPVGEVEAAGCAGALLLAGPHVGHGNPDQHPVHVQGLVGHVPLPAGRGRRGGGRGLRKAQGGHCPCRRGGCGHWSGTGPRDRPGTPARPGDPATSAGPGNFPAEAFAWS